MKPRMADPFGGELVDIWSAYFASESTTVGESEIVSDNYKEIGTLLFGHGNRRILKQG